MAVPGRETCVIKRTALSSVHNALNNSFVPFTMAADTFPSAQPV